MVDDFEDGKEIEEYSDALAEIEKTLAIEAEKFPQGQPLEQVAEVVEKPVKKKEPEKKIADIKKPEVKAAPQIVFPPTPPLVEPQQVTTYTEKEVATSIAPPSEPTPPVTIQKPTVEEVTLQPPVQSQQPVFRGIDAYIEETATAVGIQAKETFRNNAYTNLFAVINGQVRLVPIEQEQPAEESQQQPIDQQEAYAAEIKIQQLKQIELALKDPAIKAKVPQLIKLRCEILEIPFSDAMVPVEAPLPTEVQPTPPVSSKLAEKEKPKRSGMSRMKLIGSAIAIALVAAIGVILAIGFFMS